LRESSEIRNCEMEKEWKKQDLIKEGKNET